MIETDNLKKVMLDKTISDTSKIVYGYIYSRKESDLFGGPIGIKELFKNMTQIEDIETLNDTLYELIATGYLKVSI